MIALGFPSSLGARMFEQYFKMIQFDGNNAWLWSEVTKGLRNLLGRRPRPV